MSATTEHPAGWDTTTDADNPQPQVWPACPTCDTVYAYRQFLSLSGGMVWAWSKDCKHKVAAVLHTKDGPYEPDASAYLLLPAAHRATARLESCEQDRWLPSHFNAAFLLPSFSVAELLVPDTLPPLDAA